MTIYKIHGVEIQDTEIQNILSEIKKDKLANMDFDSNNDFSDVEILRFFDIYKPSSGSAAMNQGSGETPCKKINKLDLSFVEKKTSLTAKNYLDLFVYYQETFGIKFDERINTDFAQDIERYKNNELEANALLPKHPKIKEKTIRYYDADGRFQGETTYHFNEFGDVTFENNSNYNDSTNYIRDDHGNILYSEVTDHAKNETRIKGDRYYYTPLGNHSIDSNVIDPDEIREFTPDGQLLRVQSLKASKVSCDLLLNEFDSHDKLVKQTLRQSCDSPQKYVYVIERSYDTNGNLILETLKSENKEENTTSFRFKKTWEYNHSGNLTKYQNILYDKSKESGYKSWEIHEYENGLLTLESLEEDDHIETTRYQYNAQGQLTLVERATTKNNYSLQQTFTTSTYHPSGSIKSVEEKTFLHGDFYSSMFSTYDSSGRSISEICRDESGKVTTKKTWSYDNKTTTETFKLYNTNSFRQKLEYQTIKISENGFIKEKKETSYETTSNPITATTLYDEYGNSIHYNSPNSSWESTITYWD